MTIDDESSLSAYLDGELTPDEAAAVERAAAADPAVAATLVALATTSEAVAGLSRCASPCGLASTILARISEPPRRRTPFWLATAASVAFAFLLASKSGLLTPRRPLVKDGLRVALNGPPKAPARYVPTEDASGADPIDQAEPPIAVDPLGPIADPAEPARRSVVDMIDRPGLRRVVVPVKAVDLGSADRVAEILREMGRKDPAFGRIFVPAGLTIDPTLPDEAEVFTATMDGREFKQFLGRLTRAFGEVGPDPTFDPAVAMQLAEASRISVGSGHKAAGLGEPPVDPALAEKADPLGRDPFEQANDRSIPDHAAGRTDGPDDPEQPDVRVRPKPATGPMTVLIWVTTKARD